MVRTDNVDYSATHFGLSGENEALSNRSLTKHLSSSEWRALENHVVRINFDAAFSQQIFRSASGLVARNERGEVIVSKSVLANRIASSFAVEAFACSQAVRLGMGMGMQSK
ncbi:hypothetical protein Gotri_027627 [Gossypium trilobum]|uniref:RNase H type-1 domain-containing protein n=1 Tax=Gossypium trilobum TaxID=34281 RepID=A0A7J9FJH1_9ROSI|nr:hypothetical protein [Gossypium trilobum]